MDDFADETEIIREYLKSYRYNRFESEINSICNFTRKMSSVKLKLLSKDQNKNATDLVNSRLREEKVKTVEYMKKRK